MAVNARKPYPLRPVDGVEHYHGNQLIYASWDRHLMFAAPFITCVPPAMLFAEYVETVLVPLIAADPDAAAIDWGRAEWLKANRPFRPDFGKSLTDNGIVHKDQLRLQTPGLNTLCGPMVELAPAN